MYLKANAIAERDGRDGRKRDSLQLRQLHRLRRWRRIDVKVCVEDGDGLDPDWDFSFLSLQLTRNHRRLEEGHNRHLDLGQSADRQVEGSSSVAVIKAAQEARKRAREREKIIKDGAIAEQRVIQAIMTHEDCLQKVKDEGETSCETFRNAATKATAMHAFDGVTALLRQARILTCQVCEAVVLWRKALDKIDALDATNKRYVGDVVTLSSTCLTFNISLSQTHSMLKAVVGHATGLDKADMGEHGSKMKVKGKSGKSKATKEKPHRPFFWGGRNVSQEL